MQMRRMGIPFLKIDAICISHIHGDHLFGLFGLLSTMSMLGRVKHLEIYAPASFAPVLGFFLSNFGEGIRFGIGHHVLAMDCPEIVAESKTTEILAFPLNHRIETYGFIIREKKPLLNVRKDYIEKYGLSLAEIGALKRGEDIVRESGMPGGDKTSGGYVIRNTEAAYRPYKPRSYAYCSDTAPFPELPGWVGGVDLLYHEATYPEEMSSLAEKTHHSTTVQAARCALEAGAGRLLIGHYSSRFHDVGPFLEEAAAVFPDTILAKEGGVIEIPQNKKLF